MFDQISLIRGSRSRFEQDIRPEKPEYLFNLRIGPGKSEGEFTMERDTELEKLVYLDTGPGKPAYL